MKYLLAIALFIFAFAVGPVWPQQEGNPAGATPGTQSGSSFPAPN